MHIESASSAQILHLHTHTLTVCPWNVLMGLSCPSLQTWMHISVLQEANVLLLCQSTSNAGAVGDRRQSWGCQQTQTPTHTLTSVMRREAPVPEWKGNCCLASPVWASQMIVVCQDTNKGRSYSWMRENYLTGADFKKSLWITLSTPALRMKLPFLFHFRAKMGPLCWPRVLARLPVEQSTRSAVRYLDITFELARSFWGAKWHGKWNTDKKKSKPVGGSILKENKVVWQMACCGLLQYIHRVDERYS